MTNIRKMIKDNDMILSDLAFALTQHSFVSYDASNFVDLTTGELVLIQREYMLDEDDVKEDLNDWEAEIIDTYQHHDLIAVESIPSYESFHIMENFAASRPENEQQHLYKALNRKHPFSCFKYAAEDLGILEQWYDFKNEAEMQMAKEWLAENKLEIKDGKIVLRLE